MFWLEKAAAQGLIRSQYSLGKMFSYGFGVPKDLNRAFGWIEKAARKGFDKAQYNLGKMYRDGKGVDDDPEASTRWLHAAAKQGYAKAQNQMGIRLAKGEASPGPSARAHVADPGRPPGAPGRDQEPQETGRKTVARTAPPGRAPGRCVGAEGRGLAIRTPFPARYAGNP